MARVKRGVTTHARHKKMVEQAAGYRGRAKTNFRIAIESRDENGNTVQRVDPRLFEAKTEVR